MSRYRGNPPSTLYVRNISDRVRFEDMRRLFSKYGKVLEITIPLDYYSGLPKGYAFVEFEDSRDAEEAQYRMDRQRLFGKEIEVEFARGERKTPGEMRNRDRDKRYPARGRPDEYDRGESRRSRSRSRGYERRERRGRSRERQPSYSRSKSRASRSYSRNRTPSPRNANGGANVNHHHHHHNNSNNHHHHHHHHHHQKSMSRERSRSRERSGSRQRGSPRRNENRSPKMNDNMSRSPSPA